MSAIHRTALWHRRKNAAKKRDGFKCSRPGCDCTEGLTVHHKTPVCEGGSNDLDNLLTLCYDCHLIFHPEYAARGEL